MIYKISDLIVAMLLGIIIGVLIVGAVIIDADATPDWRRQCNAPCTVVLPPGTLEDEFWINYGWKGNRPRVDVFVRKNG